ncbi:MAG: hypothetical protein ACM3UU_09330 [Ignavibacteriales bacterium]
MRCYTLKDLGVADGINFKIKNNRVIHSKVHITKELIAISDWYSSYVTIKHADVSYDRIKRHSFLIKERDPGDKRLLLKLCLDSSEEDLRINRYLLIGSYFNKNFQGTIGFFKSFGDGIKKISHVFIPEKDEEYQLVIMEPGTIIGIEYVSEGMHKVACAIFDGNELKIIFPSKQNYNSKIL